MAAPGGSTSSSRCSERAVAAALLLIGALVAEAAPANAAPKRPPVAALAPAEELAALPGGAWLALDRRALRLLDATGSERARLAVRGEHLDARPAPGGALAVLLDADTQRTMAIDVDLDRFSLAAKPAIESPPWSVEALCLTRDAQGLAQVFLIGDEGLAEQWLLRPEGALQMRRLAVPPQVQACRVDDAGGWLYVLEEDQGVSAFRAEPEGMPRRRVVAGPASAATALASVPGGVLTVDRRGRVTSWREKGGSGWTPQHQGRLAGADAPESLATRVHAHGVDLLWPAARGGWRHRWLDWTAPSAVAALPVVHAAVQTEPVARFGDAADDPAVWIHPTDPARSLVLGTNKKQGLLIYGLDGRQRQLLEVGRINNVDLRQRVRVGERVLDLAAATQRDDLDVVLFEIAADGAVREAGRIPTGLKDIYGVCMARRADGGAEVLVNDKDGSFQRWRVEAGAADALRGVLLQRFRVASQPEACVADDEAGLLFIGEEKRGVWSMALADTGERPKLTLILPVGGQLRADVEGLGLYRGNGGHWLVVSSQGNDSYVVVDAAPPHRVRGAFRIALNAPQAIDGVSETDGLEVTAVPLGPAFPRGALVVQDGFKRLPDGPQNFKIVDWRDVARVLGLP